jgi:hypothetical protein
VLDLRTNGVLFEHIDDLWQNLLTNEGTSLYDQCIDAKGECTRCTQAGRSAPRAAWADRAAIHAYRSRGSRIEAASLRHPESSPVFVPFDTKGILWAQFTPVPKPQEWKTCEFPLPKARGIHRSKFNEKN